MDESTIRSIFWLTGVVLIAGGSAMTFGHGVSMMVTGVIFLFSVFTSK